MEGQEGQEEKEEEEEIKRQESTSHNSIKTRQFDTRRTRSLRIEEATIIATHTRSRTLSALSPQS